MGMNWKYMPVLKWKRGERDALRYLKDEQWEGVTPLLELQPISVAPEVAALRKALPTYLQEVAEQITKSVPVEVPVCIDTGFVSSSYAKQVNLLLVICRILDKQLEHQVVPVIRSSWLETLPGLTPSLIEELATYDAVILRFRTDQFTAAQVKSGVDTLAKIVKKRRIHLMMDQYSLVDRQAAACVADVTPYLHAALSVGCASVTLAGGSFPVNLTGKKPGFTDIPRVEWHIWSNVKKDPAFAPLRYADYTVTNPEPLPEDLDPKAVNPAIAIRYAADGFWRLFKGKGFKGAPRGELRGLCKLLTMDPVYSGEPFSYGDGKYFKDANGSDKNGVPWTWRRDATNHHMVLTADALT